MNGGKSISAVKILCQTQDLTHVFFMIRFVKIFWCLVGAPPIILDIMTCGNYKLAKVSRIIYRVNIMASGQG